MRRCAAEAPVRIPPRGRWEWMRCHVTRVRQDTAETAVYLAWKKKANVMIQRKAVNT